MRPRSASAEASVATASGPSACSIRSTTCSSSTTSGSSPSRGRQAVGPLRSNVWAAPPGAPSSARRSRAQSAPTRCTRSRSPARSGVPTEAAPAPPRGDQTIDQRDQRALLGVPRLACDGCTTSALLRSLSNRRDARRRQPPRSRLTPRRPEAASQRVFGRSQSRDELLRSNGLGIGRCDEQIGGNCDRDAEREHRPQPQARRARPAPGQV